MGSALKKMSVLIVSLLFSGIVFAAPTNTISVPNSFTANTIIQSAKVNDNNNEISTKFNTHSHTDITALGTIISGTWQATLVATQYGGTGQNFSSIASGNIIKFTDTGIMGTTTLPGSPKDMIARGFEASCSVLKTSVVVNSGTLYHGTTQVDVATNTTLTLTTAGDYASGSAVNYSGGAGWNYIGVTSSASKTTKGVYLLGTIAPQYSDASGNTDGTKLYTLLGSTYYRVIGAIRQNTSNQSALGYYQDDKLVMLDVPVEITTATSSASWTSADCSSAIPGISKHGLFEISISGNAATAYISMSLRPKNSVWQAAAAAVGNLSGMQIYELGGQVDCITDASQNIDYYNYASDVVSATSVKVKGYYLNIR